MMMRVDERENNRGLQGAKLPSSLKWSRLKTRMNLKAVRIAVYSHMDYATDWFQKECYRK